MLSEESYNKANEIFDLFKANDDDLVSEENFVNHWRGLENRICATEFFAAMDTNVDGMLSRKNFLNFWRRVK